MPRLEISHDLPEEEKICARDGEALVEIGCEASEQVEFIPATARVLARVVYVVAVLDSANLRALLFPGFGPNVVKSCPISRAPQYECSAARRWGRSDTRRYDGDRARSNARRSRNGLLRGRGH